MINGLFIGLTTVDIQYLVGQFPESNTKMESLRFTVQPGGPAFNAAVAFSYLGGNARLVTVIGDSLLKSLVESDAKSRSVELHDIARNVRNALPVSAILTEKENGNRTVINSPKTSQGFDSNELDWEALTTDIDVILFDGFYTGLVLEALDTIRGSKAHIVFDGGRWHPGIEEMLPDIRTAICSEHFAPPGVSGLERVLEYLNALGIPDVAITRGGLPILYNHYGSQGMLPVPSVPVVDTLGAGDIFHGAFCYFRQSTGSFKETLKLAAEVASRSCSSFGTRDWMT